jgi:Methyltransferase FkbM domain
LYVRFPQRPIDILKVDVEGAEWPFLRDVVVDNPNQLSDVRQLLLEIHTPRYRPTSVTASDLFEISYYMERLLRPDGDGKKSGFVVYINRHTNFCCRRFSDFMPPGIAEKCCHEVFLLNTHL